MAVAADPEKVARVLATSAVAAIGLTAAMVTSDHGQGILAFLHRLTSSRGYILRKKLYLLLAVVSWNDRRNDR